MSLRQDIGYGWRLWRKHPLPGMLSVGALALGIAAASAIFTLVNAIAIQPLPYRDSDRLVILWSVNERLGIDVKRQKSQTTSLSILEYQDWLVRSGIFEHMVFFASTLPRVTQTDDPGGIQVYVTSPGLFPMLGVKPMLGRGFEPADERRGADPVIVLQHELWMRRFRGDPSVIGQKIYLNNRPTTVIGVMGPEFVFFNRQMDAMSPAEFEAPSDSRAREFRGFRAMARLKPDLSLEQAQAKADAFSAMLARDYPQSNRDWRVLLVPANDDASEELRPAVNLLLAAVGCVLLITCANVANLLLVQASARGKELALRTAIGASRFRLIRQMVAEGLVLGCVGGAAGLAATYGLVAVLQSMVPDRTTHGKYLVQAVAMRVDPTVVGFAIAITLLSTLIVGIVSAWKASRPNISEALKDSSRGSSADTQGRAVRSALVVAEVALAALLAVGASLLVRSLMGLYDRGPGFEPAGLVAFGGVGQSWEHIDDQVRAQKLSREEADKLYRAADRSFRDRLYAQLESMSELESFTTASMLHLNGTYQLQQVTVEGRLQEPSAENQRAVGVVVGPRYFRVMGIPLVKGRDFGRQDTPDSPTTAIVSTEFVRRFVPGAEPVGKRIKFGGNPAAPWLTIVGVVGDIREDGMDRPPQAHVYRFEDQLNYFTGRIIFRARSGDSMALVPAVRQAVKAADPNASIYRVVRLQDEARGSVWKLNYSTFLMSGLALLAVCLAILGVYGVLSYVVRERTTEIGVRMALGAQRSDVVTLVVGQGLLLVGSGIIIGLIAAAALTRLLKSFLFGVASLDPASFAGVAILLLAAGFLASYLPARRAAGYDPMIALRGR
jgi:predicted permease